MILWCEINSLLSTKSIYTKPLLKFKGLSWKTSSNFTVEIVFKGNIPWHLIPFGNSTWQCEIPGLNEMEDLLGKGCFIGLFCLVTGSYIPNYYPSCYPNCYPNDNTPMIIPQWFYPNDYTPMISQWCSYKSPCKSHSEYSCWFRSKGGHEGNHHFDHPKRIEGVVLLWTSGWFKGIPIYRKSLTLGVVLADSLQVCWLGADHLMVSILLLCWFHWNSQKEFSLW